MSIGTVAFKKNLNTTDQEKINITYARAIKIALGECEEDATYQGFGAKYFYDDLATKTENNKEIFQQIQPKIIQPSKPDKPHNFGHALAGITPSPIINKFISFNRMRNITDGKTDKNKFRTSIICNKSIYGTRSYQITFSIQDDKASTSLYNKIYNKFTDRVHLRNNSMTFDLSEEEALFISQYIQDESTGTLIDNIDPAQVAMQYLLSKQDISEYRGDIQEYELEGPGGEEYKTSCEEQKTYINTLATILRKDFNSSNVPVDSSKIRVINKANEKDINTGNIQLEFSINNNDRVKIEYREILEQTIDASGKEIFKVARRDKLYMVKIKKDAAKNQETYSIKQENSNNTKPVFGILFNNYIADKLASIKNDNGENLFANLEASIMNYAIKNAVMYEIFLRNHSSLNSELELINNIDNSNSFGQKLVTRLNSVDNSKKYKDLNFDALAGACNFFMHDSSNNRVIKEIEKLGVPKEILIAKLVRSNRDILNHLNNYIAKVKNYVSDCGEYYKSFLEEDKLHLAIALHTHDTEIIDSFFSNLNVNPQVLLSINFESYLEDTQSFTKQSVTKLLNDICIAQSKDTINKIKQIEIEKLSNEDRNAMLELVTIKHSELNCYGIQDPDKEVAMFLAIRDNNNFFEQEQMVDTNNKKSYLVKSDSAEYKAAKHFVGQELERIVQNIENMNDTLTNNTNSCITDDDYDSTDDLDSSYSIESNYDDIETKYDRLPIDDKSKAIRAATKIKRIKEDFNPIELTKRFTYVEEDKKQITHAELYTRNLIKLYYEILDFKPDEVPLRPLNEDGIVCEILKEKLKTFLLLNYHEYKKDISKINHLTRNKILVLANGQEYIVSKTVGNPNNSLIYAIAKNNTEQLNRETIFTSQNIINRLFQKSTQISAINSYIKDSAASSQEKMRIENTETINTAIALRTMIKTVYNQSNNFLNKIKNNLDIVDISQKLSNYITQSDCPLDIEIAAPIIAQEINKDILIITKNAEKPDQFSAILVKHRTYPKYHRGLNKVNKTLEEKSESSIKYYKTLDKDRLNKIGNSKGTVFIYKNDENHFELLQEIGSIIRANNKQVKTVSFAEDNSATRTKTKSNAIKDKNKSYSRSNIQLANNKIYNIKTTSGEDNNCLIYAITKGNIGNLNRQTIFSPENIREHWIQTEGTNDEIAAGVVTGNTLMTIIGTVKAIYNELSDVLNNVPSLDVLAATLSKHIIKRGDFLDTQIAGSMIARQLAKNVLIITPENGNRLSYSFIRDNGRFSDERDLDKIERDYPNVVFIYNRNGTHFEWLEKVTNDVQNVF